MFLKTSNLVWFSNTLKHLMVAMLSLFIVTGFAQDGEKIFKANCASCHRVDDKKMTGPGLQGVFDRVPEPQEEWLKAWIRNSQKVIASGDAYAVELFNQYNKTIMPSMEHLSDADLDALLAYIKNPPVKKEETASTETTAVAAQPEQVNALPWLIVLLVIFFVLAISLSNLRRNLQALVKKQRGEEWKEENIGYIQEFFLWFKNNPKFTTFLIICLLGIGAVKGYHALMNIGVYQGYQPEQPIKFSHKIHAGDDKINCVYCHSGAERGKTAGIPSVNVCMNCHKAISEGKRWGTEEIAKIYEAAGYNPETGQYDKPQKPIKWIRIHNLPDFTYFNHSQHVVAGKQKCQTCHGPVEEIDYPMYQYAPLTMGWCINCHRETAVDMGNPYYEKIHQELLEKYKEEGKTTFTVEDIGGLECAKCHY